MMRGPRSFEDRLQGVDMVDGGYLIRFKRHKRMLFGLWLILFTYVFFVTLGIIAIFAVDLVFVPIFAFVFSSFPLLAALYIFIKLSKAPKNISIMDEGIEIGYVFPFPDIHFTYKDMKDLEKYSHIELDDGSVFKLPELNNEQWDIVTDSMMLSDALTSGHEGPDEDLMGIIERKGEEPKEIYDHSGRPLGLSMLFGLFIFFSAFMVLIGIFTLIKGSSLFDSDGNMMTMGLCELSFGIVTLVLEMIVLVKGFKKRHIHVGPDGIRYSHGSNVKFNESWENMMQVRVRQKPITNYSRRRYYHSASVVMDLIRRDGMGMEISSAQIGGKAFKKSFRLMKRYCAYHDVDLINEVGL